MNPTFGNSGSNPNPIGKVIDNVFGIGSGNVSSYQEKMDRLRQAIMGNDKAARLVKEEYVRAAMYKKYSDPSVNRGLYTYDMDAFKRDFNIEKVPNKIIASFEGRNQLFNLFGFSESYGAGTGDKPVGFWKQEGDLLRTFGVDYSFTEKGIIFSKISREGTIFTYGNASPKAMYSLYDSSTNRSMLPDQIFETMEQYFAGHTLRKRLNVRSPFFKGIYKPEIGRATLYQSLAQRDKGTESLYLAMDKYQQSLANINQLVATSGRYVPDKTLIRKRTAIDSFNQNVEQRDKYIYSLTQELKSRNRFNTYMFTKPEFFSGDRDVFLMASGRYTQRYGTRFEKSAATKGLFQVANMADTTEAQFDKILAAKMQPSVGYYVEGSGNSLNRSLNLRVGVIDFVSEFHERAFLGDSGSLLTETGVMKLQGARTFGSINLKDSSDETIKAIEEVFGVNLGQQKLYNLNASIKNATKESIDILSKNNNTFRGLFEILEREKGVLERVNFTDSGIQLAFAQSSEMMPNAPEMITGTRRTTADIVEGTIPKSNLYGKGVKKLLKNSLGVDKIISSSEFYKMHGPELFLNNFVSVIQTEAKDQAVEIFKNVFGVTPTVIRAPDSKKQFISAGIKDFDSAYDAAIRWIAEGKEIDIEKKNRLIKLIQEGAKMDLGFMDDPSFPGGVAGKAAMGIKEMRMFYIPSALRVDYGGDINVTKPIRYTMSHLQTIASGGDMFGYSSPYTNPVIRAILGRGTKSGEWRTYVDKKTRQTRIGKNRIGFNQFNMIDVGENHLARELVFALKGKPRAFQRNIIDFSNEIDPVTKLRVNRFTYKGKVLKDLPRLGMDNIPYEDLKGTLFGSRQQMLYLKLKDPITYLGEKLEYLPIPKKYLRVKQRQGSFVVNKDSALESLLAFFGGDGNKDFESNSPPDHIGNYLNRLAISISGKTGGFNRYSTILSHAGSRVRLSVGGNYYHSIERYTDPKRMFDVVMSKQHFEDLLTIKSSSMPERQVKFYKKALARGDDLFYGFMSVDPMQRAEHGQVVRIILDKNMDLKSGFFGHFKIRAHSALLKMMERDNDRDVAKLFLLDSSVDNNNKVILNAEFRKLLAKQEERAKPYLLFERYRLSRAGYDITDPEKGLSKNRFKKMINSAFANLEEAIHTYIPLPKSLGYTLARGPQEIMHALVYGGQEAMRTLDIASGALNEVTLNSFIHPFLGEAGKTRFSVSSQFLQSILQSTVQKAGAGKEGLITATESLLKIAHKNQEITSVKAFQEAISEGADILYQNIILPQETKQRMFLGTKDLLEDYTLLEKYGVKDAKETVKLVLQDLERGAYQALDDAQRARIDLVDTAVQKAMSYRMSEVLVPGMILGKTTKASFRNIISIGRGDPVSGETAEQLERAIRTKIINPLSRETITDQISGKLEKTKQVISETPVKRLTETVKKAVSEFKPGFGTGLAIGGLLGLGAASMLSDDDPMMNHMQAMSQPPMPRDIDYRQPEDVGPVIPAPRPRIYGTSQVFGASRTRNPQIIGSPTAYSMGNQNSGRMQIVDKTAPNNPYLLQMHLRNVSRSEYNY